MEGETIAYLSSLLGENVSAEELTAAEQRRVGWLVNFYGLRSVVLRGRRHVLAFGKAGQHYTPAVVAKQLSMGRSALGLPLVYVPRELGPHDIPRLIAANVPFALSRRGLFLPELGLSVSRASQPQVLRETFSVPVQLLVLGYLLKLWDGQLTIAEGMKYTGFSLGSIVHAFQEIEHFGAGERSRGVDGRSVTLHLKGAREIWESCRTRFFNPCRRMVGVASRPGGSVLAGVDALARISSLNEDEPTCFAMPAKGFRSLGIEELSPSSAPCRLQLWRYSPTVLGGDAIDPASLFLSLRDEPDDRVQIELDRLQEKFRW